MSLENAKRFIEATSKDQALQQRLAAVREPEETVRLAVQVGSERGLTFTAEELLLSIGPLPGGGGSELSADQLESVAGGFGLSPSSIAALFARAWGDAGTPGENEKQWGMVSDSLPPGRK